MSNTTSLKIGISSFFQHSFFSNGLATTMMSLADALASLGHTPILVNINSTVDWYEDCQSIKKKYERRNICEWKEKKYDLLDIFIDIDGFIVSEQRRAVAKKIVVFFRKPMFVNELEKSVYPLQQPVRDTKNCDAIWIWEHFGDQDAYIAELLSQRPVFRIPYTWSESGVESYGAGLPSWMETRKQIPENAPWACHISESNSTMANNFTLPIVIAAYVKTHTSIPFKECILHNSTNINEQTFFKENVLSHCKRDDLKFEFLGRQRITDWKSHPGSFMLSHIRFIDRKPYLFDCIWNGIPLVHNSPFLKSIGFGLENLYYADNSVKGASKAIETMVANYTSRSGFFAPDSLSKIRSALKAQFSPLANRDAWNRAFQFEVGAPIEMTRVVPLAPIVLKDILPSSDTVAGSSKDSVSKKELVVGFSDLWADANYEYNFWTLLLQEACPTMKIRGIQITDSTVNQPMDLLIFGTFGTTWTRVPSSVPKVHSTGENTGTKTGSGVYLNLGFEKTNTEKGIYRFPLWIQYIDWFGADQARLVNPRSMPVDSVANVDMNMLQSKKKFCAFIVSNPTNPVRNEAFHQLSAYKHVDSAGRLFNTVGETIFTEIPGGGGGELKKWEFLKDYKFSLTYENARGNGYVTEKFLAAKAAGCVPIYWGALNVTDDFSEGSFLNANECKTANDLIQLVQSIDESEENWLKMASMPCISIEKERKRLATVASLILKPILGESFQVPTHLGASSTAEAAILQKKRESTMTLVSAPSVPSVPSETHVWNGSSLLVTFASQIFMQSLLQWLEGINLFVKHDTQKKARVYLADDVDEIQYNLLRTDNPNIQFKRIPSKTYKVDDFPDLWEPKHYAWKLWIYQSIVQEEDLKNTLIWYMDAGSLIVRWPQEWLNLSIRDGICVLEDDMQKNDQWCHEVFCKRLSVTEEEKQSQQIVGGIMSFIAGAKKPWGYFTEAWAYGQKRDIIVGPKWGGLLPDGRPCGHRHDQSILSILRLRHNLTKYPLYNVYNHESIRRTLKSGASLYVHRGFPKEHENFSARIGEVHLINLKRRKDRIKRFKENHEAWTKLVCLRPAYDGRALRLTPGLAKLFAPNDFLWKKAIMGCALSHLSIWIELASEMPCCENYLILEDDVKFEKKWMTRWKEAEHYIPDDYDVLYLGGVLPPNREVFLNTLEPVNEHWSQIKNNQIFGQQTPSRYFHFCNYAYILSRKGAQKILEDIRTFGGYVTSADHMVCNRIDTMKHYVLNPLVAGCYQDEDPKYQASAFNNFNRIDGFDSDLWNNDERFTETEIQTALKSDDSMVDILSILKENHQATQVEELPLAPPAPAAPSAPTLTTNISSTARFYTVGSHISNLDSLLKYQLEAKWIRQCIGPIFDTITNIDKYHEPLTNAPIFLVSKPHFDTYLQVFQRYEAAQQPFYAIHISDEFCSDPINWYMYKSCKGVLRNYIHPDCQSMNHVYTLPLGPNNITTNQTQLKDRKTIWSFFGTNWMNRDTLLAPMKQIIPHTCTFFPTWMDSKNISASEYSAICLDSIFIPCPKGQNVETFRFWEALDHGAIPIYVREPGDDLYFNYISSKLPLISLPSWIHAHDYVQSLLQNTPTLLRYRDTLIQKWMIWKLELQTDCKRILDL